MKNRPTIQDLANKAGVSTYSASQAMSGQKGIGAETRKRILQAANEIGYVPNAVAASLKGRKSNAVGVMTASGRNQYYSMLVQAIDSVLQGNGMHAVTNDAMRGGNFDEKLQDQSVNDLLQQRVAAIVATYPLSEKNIELIQKWNIPLLFVDALPSKNSGPHSFVGCDNVASGKLVADFLADTGCMSAVVIAYPKEWNTRAPRESAFVKRAKQLKIQIHVVESENSQEGAYEALSKYFKGGDIPDALYALNTPLLQGALKAIKGAGLRIPKDISIIGFDEFDWAEFIDPPMTVVDQHIDEIGRIAGEALLKLIRDESEKSSHIHIAVVPTITERKSCKKRLTS